MSEHAEGPGLSLAISNGFGLPWPTTAEDFEVVSPPQKTTAVCRPERRIDLPALMIPRTAISWSKRHSACITAGESIWRPSTRPDFRATDRSQLAISNSSQS